jgi:hypothetical protein
MNLAIKFGLAALALEAFSTFSSKAETPDIFTRHELPSLEPTSRTRKASNKRPLRLANQERVLDKRSRKRRSRRKSKSSVFGQQMSAPKGRQS